MKKIVLMVAAALAVCPAIAQNAKLNFEAPLFGVTMKNVKPQWSFVVFSGAEAGASNSLAVPEAMHRVGFYANATLVELQFRPGRNQNLLSCGVTLSMDRHYLKKDQFAFGDDGSMVKLPNIAPYHNQSLSMERAVSLKLAYIREIGNWKTGIILLPGFGVTTQRNSYTSPYHTYTYNPIEYPMYDSPLRFRTDDRGSRFQDDASGNIGFRLAAKAGLWYRNMGLTAGYSDASIGPHGFSKRYDTFTLGLSVQY